MWHVSSRSGVATLRTAIHLLLTYLLTRPRGGHLRISVRYSELKTMRRESRCITSDVIRLASSCRRSAVPTLAFDQSHCSLGRRRATVAYKVASSRRAESVVRRGSETRAITTDRGLFFYSQESR